MRCPQTIREQIIHASETPSINTGAKIITAVGLLAYCMHVVRNGFPGRVHNVSDLSFLKKDILIHARNCNALLVRIKTYAQAAMDLLPAVRRHYFYSQHASSPVSDDKKGRHWRPLCDSYCVRMYDKNYSSSNIHLIAYKSFLPPELPARRIQKCLKTSCCSLKVTLYTN